MTDRKTDQIETLYRTELERLERIATRKIGAPNASDVVHDVFSRIWERTKEHIVLTPAYLSQCVRNAAIDLIRIENRHNLELPRQCLEKPGSDCLTARLHVGTSPNSPLYEG